MQNLLQPHNISNDNNIAMGEFEYLASNGTRENINNYVDINIVTNISNKNILYSAINEGLGINLRKSVRLKINNQKSIRTKTIKRLTSKTQPPQGRVNKTKRQPSKTIPVPIPVPINESDIEQYAIKSLLYALRIFNQFIIPLITKRISQNAKTVFHLYDNANCAIYNNLARVFKKQTSRRRKDFNIIFSSGFEQSERPISPAHFPDERRIDANNYIYSLNCVKTCEADDYALILTYKYLRYTQHVYVYSDDNYNWFEGDGDKKWMINGTNVRFPCNSLIRIQ